MKPSDLIKDLNTFGFMFESLCMRDLKIYTGSHGGDITFYRDKNITKNPAIEGKNKEEVKQILEKKLNKCQ